MIVWYYSSGDQVFSEVLNDPKSDSWDGASWCYRVGCVTIGISWVFSVDRDSPTWIVIFPDDFYRVRVLIVPKDLRLEDFACNCEVNVDKFSHWIDLIVFGLILEFVGTRWKLSVGYHCRRLKRENTTQVIDTHWPRGLRWATIDAIDAINICHSNLINESYSKWIKTLTVFCALEVII